MSNNVSSTITIQKIPYYYYYTLDIKIHLATTIYDSKRFPQTIMDEALLDDLHAKYPQIDCKLVS